MCECASVLIKNVGVRKFTYNTRKVMLFKREGQKENPPGWVRAGKKKCSSRMHLADSFLRV